MHLWRRKCVCGPIWQTIRNLLLRAQVLAVTVALTAGLAQAMPAHALTPGHHRAHPPVESASTNHRAAPATSGCTAGQPCGHIPCDLYDAYATQPTAGDDGSGQTIAVIDPYGTATVQADFTAYSAAFRLASTPLSIKQPFGVDLTQSDAPANMPGQGWDLEIPLGVEWAHALAPAAQIVLVEARTSIDSDMIGAIDYAVTQLNADVVNMSWTFDESGPAGYDQATILTWDSHFPPTNSLGRPVSYTAATGDAGPTPAWPAVSPNVIAVGGTSITPAGFNGQDTSSHSACPASPSPPYANSTNETVYGSTGGGASAFEPAPPFQSGIAPGPKRDTPDVAMLADPNAGVAVYLRGSWWGSSLGGTSVAAPMWAALVSRLNEQKHENLSSVSWLYSAYRNNPNGFDDVTTGSSTTGTNPRTTISAGTGYDEVTGLGAPLWNHLPMDVAPPAPPPAMPFTAYFPWFDRISDPGFMGDNIHVVNPNQGDVTVDVKIPGQPQGCDSGNTVIHGGQEAFFTCPSGFGGPVVVAASQRVIASQRVQYYQSFNEVKALTPADVGTSLVFTWYDHVSNAGFAQGSDNIHVVNPGPGTAHVTVTIPGCSQPFNAAILSKQEQYLNCLSGFGGPVTVTSDTPVLASQRVKYYSSFNEVPGMPASSGNYSLWLSWFDRVSDPGFLGDNVHVWAPQQTNVTVTTPGCPPSQPTPIAAGAEQTFTCATGFGGPVHVMSDNSTNVLATQRVEYNQTFNEVTAQSIDSDGAPLWIAWYDLRSSPGFVSDNVHVLNPGSDAITYTVTIPGCSSYSGDAPSSGPLAGGSEVYISCPGGFGGPVEVTATGPVLAAARTKYFSSFNEVTAST